MKNVIITGANRGIGLALTKELSEQDNNIYACVRSIGPKLDNLISQKTHSETWIRPIFFNGLEDEKSIKDCIREIFQGGVLQMFLLTMQV